MRSASATPWDYDSSRTTITEHVLAQQTAGLVFVHVDGLAAPARVKTVGGRWNSGQVEVDYLRLKRLLADQNIMLHDRKRTADADDDRVVVPDAVVTWDRGNGGDKKPKLTFSCWAQFATEASDGRSVISLGPEDEALGLEDKMGRKSLYVNVAVCGGLESTFAGRIAGVQCMNKFAEARMVSVLNKIIGETLAACAEAQFAEHKTSTYFRGEATKLFTCSAEGQYPLITVSMEKVLFSRPGVQPLLECM